MPDLDPRTEHLLRPLADDVARATDLPSFDGVLERHDLHRRRARRRTGAVVSAAAVAAAVVVAGALTVAGGDRADAPGPSAPASSTTPGSDEEQEREERVQELAEARQQAAAEALVADGDAGGSAVTPGGDVATLWGTTRGTSWAIAVRRADGTTSTTLLPYTSTVPLVHATASGFLVVDPTTASSAAVDLDGRVTDPASPGDDASPAPGDVAFTADVGGDTVLVYSPADGTVRPLPPLGVDRVGDAVVTAAGDVVALWATYGPDEGSRVGVARWDGAAWQRQTLDTTPASAGGVMDEGVDTGLLATAGPWLVATTTDDRGAGTVRTAWSSDDGGATWAALDRATLPDSSVSLAVTPSGTVVAGGYPWDGDRGELVRAPRDGDPSVATAPVLADVRWTGDALWGVEESATGLTLQRSTDDGRTWEVVPLAGRG